MAAKYYIPQRHYKPRRCVPLLVRFLTKVSIGDDCWEWLAAKRTGYGVIGKGGNGYNLPVLLAHRLSYQFFVGNIPKGLFVCHRCDNKSCVRPSHLFLGTNSDNIKDAVHKGVKIGCAKTPKFGTDNPAAKLTQEKVRGIRIQYATTPITYKELGKQYGVSWAMIGQIVKGNNWSGDIVDFSHKPRVNRQKGEGHPGAKLSMRNVKNIRRSYKSGSVRLKDLAEKYGVGVSAIHSIVKGRNWPIPTSIIDL